MTSIDSVKAIVSKRNGFAKLNRYKVILPTLFIGDDPIAMDALCRATMLPGKTINTFEKRTNQKPINVAQGYALEPVQMQFSETNDHMVAKYIDFWQNTIVNPNDYLVEYRDYYTRNIFIMAMNEQDEITYACLLKKAWPKSKIQLDYSDESPNTIVRQPVSFEYEDYEIIDPTLTGTIKSVITAVRAQRLAIPISNAINLVRKII